MVCMAETLRVEYVEDYERDWEVNAAVGQHVACGVHPAIRDVMEQRLLLLIET